MNNPFASLGKKDAPEEDWEEVLDSALACQKCKTIVREGRYSDSQEILMWDCACGYQSKMSIKL